MVLLTLFVAPFGFFDPLSLGDVILDIAIVVLVMRWQPRRAGTRSMSSGNSAVDGGSEASSPKRLGRFDGVERWAGPGFRVVARRER